MASKKIFNGLADNMVHHAQSYLSYLHPHLGEACEAAGIKAVTLDLLNKPTYSENFPISKPLEKATESFLERFKEMAEKLKLDLSKVKKAVLHFDHLAASDSHSFEITSEFELSDGTKYSHTSKPGSFGEKTEEKIPDTNLSWPKRVLKRHSN